MKNMPFSKTLEVKYINIELWKRIEALNLQLIIDRMLIKHGWDEERASNAIIGYRRYLYLTQMAEISVSPTRDIDLIWHEHIIHTNKYELDCRKMFGKFLHHLPTPSKWVFRETQEDGDCQSSCCNAQNCSNDSPSRVSVTTTGDLLVWGEPASKALISQAMIDFDNPIPETDRSIASYEAIAPIFFSL